MNISKSQLFTAKLGYKKKVSSKVYVERFDLVEPKEISFLSGQTVMLKVAAGINRSMSIASPPSEKNSILVAHDVSPMGPYSQWTINAKVGDTMEFMGPLGNFIAYKPACRRGRESPRRKIFVATGTGIAPFRSMILDMPSEPMMLYWGLRHEEDIFWQKEFEELSHTYPNFQFVLTLSQPTTLWVGKQGHACDHVFAEEKNLPDADFYLCGNKDMVNEMRTRLSAAGVPNAQVKFELFY